MKETYYVTVKYDDDSMDSIVKSSNHKLNLEDEVKKSPWLECEETKRHVNMNKVKWFQIEKVN